MRRNAAATRFAVFFALIHLLALAPGIAAAAPVITGPASATGKVGVSYSEASPLAAITATGGPTWYTCEGTFPDGLFLARETGRFTGNTWEAGVFGLSCTASNASGTSAPYQVTLTIEDSIPQITSPASVTLQTSDPYYPPENPFYRITATEEPTWFDAEGLPSAIYLARDTGAIYGSPADAGPGSWDVTLYASNALGRRGSASLELAIEVPDGLDITVTNTSGGRSDEGSLPWAVQLANTSGSPATISFDLPGSAPHVIRLEDIVWVSGVVHVDATTQPGYAGEPVVHVDANGNESAFILLDGPAAGSTLAGMQIYNFTNAGIATQPGADWVTIRDNHIGFYRDGASWWRNFEQGDPAGSAYTKSVGIGIQSSWGLIEGNVISGVHNGISIGYDPAGTIGPDNLGNEIRNNRVGTTPDGTAILTNTPGAQDFRPDPADPVGTPDEWALFGNNSDGIYLTAGAKRTIIAGNLCSGNFSVGIELLHDTVEDSLIYGNWCGVDVTGSQRLPNGELGIILSNGAHDNIVGGERAPNVFSGNPFAGVQLGGEGSFRSSIDNLVKGNVIGCSADKTAVINAQDVGIHIGTPDSHGNRLEANVICGNNWGIYLDRTLSNLITANYVGVTDTGMAAGNIHDGIVLDAAHDNQVVRNEVRYNGWESDHGDWGVGIWNFNGSSGNLYAENTIADNRNPPGVESVPLPAGLADWSEEVQKVYIAYYGRPGDPGGVSFWSDELAAGGGDLRAIIQQFGTSAEFDERYGDLDYGALIDTIYDQMFARAPDDAGRAFYLEQLQSGAMTLQTITLDVLNGAQNEDAATIANKLPVAVYFTREIDRLGLAYTSDGIDGARSVLDAVGADPASKESAFDLADSVLGGYPAQ